MSRTLLNNIPSAVLALILMLGMIACFAVGNRVKAYQVRKHFKFLAEGFTAVEGSLLGLLALFLSFTFGIANSRYETRYQVMVKEANNISTSYLRSDLFPDSVRDVFRQQIKQYLDRRIDLYDAGSDPVKTAAAQQTSSAQSHLIWYFCSVQAHSTDASVRTAAYSMVTALNDMMDSVTERQASRDNVIPSAILVQLLILCLAAGFMVGYERTGKMDWVMVTGFSGMIALAVFAILDLDQPHSGLITLDHAESNFLHLRQVFSIK